MIWHDKKDKELYYSIQDVLDSSHLENDNEAIGFLQRVIFYLNAIVMDADELAFFLKIGKIQKETGALWEEVEEKEEEDKK